MSVIVGVMVSMESDLRNLPMLDGFDNELDADDHLVEASNPGQIADFIDICRSETVDSVTDETCFIVRHSDSSFDIDDPKNDIGSEMETDEDNVVFVGNEYEREVLTITFRVADNEIVVEE